MAITWQPDTCACELEVIDWALSQGRTIRACADHVGLLNGQHFSVVYLENKLKNLAFGTLVTQVPPLEEAHVQREFTVHQARVENRRRLGLVRVGVNLSGLTDAEIEADMEAAGMTLTPVGRTPGGRVSYRYLAAPFGTPRPIVFEIPEILGPARVELHTLLDTLYGNGRVRIV